MKNYEKYFDKVLEAASNVIAVNKKGKPFYCGKNSCQNCIFDAFICNKETLKWLKEEYVEPEVKVDWSKVEVDTKVLVRNLEVREWIPRYFAKYENGEVYVFNHGATSYTAEGTCKYRFAKLYEGEQELCK